ncbi:hypothetical protein, partial [Pseudomonas ogarae]|uniref:hypothetical protein n=1 Tax=Pseudomonas ogarae (strain DSM 112162 / CECT 30235 / F113) TaxID=1114970 RepID=UPI0019521143
VFAERAGPVVEAPIQALACVAQSDNGLATTVEECREWPTQIVRFIDNDMRELRAYDGLME